MSHLRPPTQGLLLEVLAARRRLGERLWTFDSSPAMSKALAKLECDGLVQTMHGVVENTVRASLTDDGMRELFPSGIHEGGYLSPLEVERNRLQLERDNLRRELDRAGLS